MQSFDSWQGRLHRLLPAAHHARKAGRGEWREPAWGSPDAAAGRGIWELSMWGPLRGWCRSVRMTPLRDGGSLSCM